MESLITYKSARRMTPRALQFGANLLAAQEVCLPCGRHAQPVALGLVRRWSEGVPCLPVPPLTGTPSYAMDYINR